MAKNGRSAKQYAEAIRNARGFVSVAARQLGVTRKAVYNAINKYDSVREAVTDARENMTDLAEGKLVEQINEGNTTAIIFYLKTQGKQRGYVERHELTGAGGGPITINVEYKNRDKRNGTTTDTT